MKYLISIDPGKTGAMAVFDLITKQPTVVESFPITREKLIDYAKLHALVRPFAYQSVAVIERVVAFNMGVTSALNYGENYGAWKGVLAANSIECHSVRPSDWKKALGLSKEKDEAIKMAETLYPHTQRYLRRKKDHDRAEAILIGYYALNHLEGVLSGAQVV